MVQLASQVLTGQLGRSLFVSRTTHFGDDLDKNHEKMRQQAADARLVHLNEQIVFPLLQRNVDDAIAAICHELKATGQVSLSKVAYIAACRDLVIELEGIARTGDRAAGKLIE